ncbi:MAG: polysaccharide biosynthesis protein [Candidatus Aminicenantes bacterium]|nr:polysaccharide biosynthesis protein [Candidatus Aminicenantes bacterium]
MKRILKPSPLKRILFFLFVDIVIIIASFHFSFFLRFGFTFPKEYHHLLLVWTAGLIGFNILLLFLAGLYHINWRFVGLNELWNLGKIALISLFIIYFTNILIRQKFPGFDLPRGIVVINSFLCFTFLGILRISKRIFIQIFKNRKLGKKTLIIGADLTGVNLIKELIYEDDQILYPVAIIDDDEMKIGTRVEGIKITGGFKMIPEIIKKLNIESVLLNLPKAFHKDIAKLFNMVKKSGIDDIKMVPRVDEFDRNVHRLKNFQDIAIEDLLSREPVKIEFNKIADYLREKVIMVTGAAGSIGSEIVRQLIRFGVRRIIGFEIDETEVFNLKSETDIIIKPGQTVDFIIGDIRDKQKLEQVIKETRPHKIFHAAAYKHVPLMEKFPDEAVKTNIFGTFNLVDLAARYKIEKLVNISTDKAVNPTSIMGASKRMAEIITNVYNSQETKMISVRFGNVLGSRGSVIPVFLSQIQSGGPIRITHKDMKRYFMAIPEAVLLVLQACVMGKGGETFVLDMGKPVKIVELAKNLIALNKLEPYKDIDIVFTGLRPGEKLFEELLTAEEGTDMTFHEKIFIARNGTNITSRRLKLVLKELEKSIQKPDKIVTVLKRNIPYYNSQ